MHVNYFAHPSAIVESKNIGEGTKIWHFAHVRENASIGAGCVIGKSTYVDTETEIGNNVKVQNFVSVYKGVRIEDDVFVGPSVTFTNDLCPRAFIWGEDRIKPTIVRKGASIGANSTILCGVNVGEYALIGAGSVVTRDVEPFTLVYGNPARSKGIVCYCGNKLGTHSGKEKGKTTYKCDCGKTVEIKHVVK